ncbi:phosphoribosylpyrophosphate synthetase [Pontibacter sp. HSC-14F20]|uniref:phosphoribosylpyrophosphate synthetase n=1 Tax=Pontibacter sp. HSC-14F20 TaxID=2864136 RepID=UPI001C73CCFC|nr:phosphoribosylpyrophosphate synthetase [Pontibacter sp. HSC-14F20]MBX0331848.1 phosphoribosylpyrophosphate synthetase [Pontibacter sp. HSC-14F20]
MTHYSYDTLSGALNGLKQRGYTEDFNLKENCIVCTTKPMQLKPEEFNIDEVHRFEGMSNPDDNSVVYAISSTYGVKGVLLDAYGAYSEAITPEMAKKLRA